MIECSINDLMQRCKSRGYSMEEVAGCIVAVNGDRVVIDVGHPAYPRTPRPGYETIEWKSASPPTREQGAPSFVQKVRNFATAAAGHVAAGMPMASDEEIIRRHDICLACEHLVDNACTQCGCPVSRVRGYVSKLSWADQECPLGKWGKVSEKQP